VANDDIRFVTLVAGVVSGSIPGTRVNFRFYGYLPQHNIKTYLTYRCQIRTTYIWDHSFSVLDR
jgi:hypothetical protein